jgi:hypothetical protein
MAGRLIWNRPASALTEPPALARRPSIRFESLMSEDAVLLMEGAGILRLFMPPLRSPHSARRSGG